MAYTLMGLLGLILIRTSSSKHNKNIKNTSENEEKVSKIDKSIWDRVKFIKSPNFTKKDNRSIDRIVIHITQGSFASAIGWFKMKSSKVSAHFLVSRAGVVVQMVELHNVAWHAAPYNTRSIGIEHEGYYNYQNKTTEFTKEQYMASAALVRALANKYNIPLDREHIIGHREVPKVIKDCPGYAWDWDYYMGLLGNKLD